MLWFIKRALKRHIMANSSPLVVIEKVEYVTNNHVDTAEIIHTLHRIYRAVKQDTAAEQALIRENDELRQQLQDVLTGNVLPPEVQKKVDAIFEQSKKNSDALLKGIEENQPLVS